MSETRRRMLDATAALIRRRGFAASSLADILGESGAPRGSLYHHFPGGKDELVLEATRRSVARLTEALETVLEETGDPVRGFRAYVDAALAELEDSDFGLGCPVASVVLDDPEPDSALAELCREAVDGWERLYATHLARAGLDAPRAAALATLLVAGVEGAILVARARRTVEPLETTRDELAGMLEHALARGRSRATSRPDRRAD